MDGGGWAWHLGQDRRKGVHHGVGLQMRTAGARVVASCYLSACWGLRTLLTEHETVGHGRTASSRLLADRTAQTIACR